MRKAMFKISNKILKISLLDPAQQTIKRKIQEEIMSYGMGKFNFYPGIFYDWQMGLPPGIKINEFYEIEKKYNCRI